MERQIVDYEIIAGDTMGVVIHRVKAAIDKGWQPLGGPFITDSYQGTLTAQAMVMYEAAPRVYGMSIGIATPDHAATFNKDLERMADPVRYMGTVMPNPAQAPTPPSDAPGGDCSQLLEAATFAMHALTDRRPGGVPNGEEALARLVAAIEGTELHARWSDPAGGE